MLANSFSLVLLFGSVCRSLSRSRSYSFAALTAFLSLCVLERAFSRTVLFTTATTYIPLTLRYSVHVSDVFTMHHFLSPPSALAVCYPFLVSLLPVLTPSSYTALYMTRVPPML
ncbi:hypothetical protein C8Q76DRAFT_355946 [Earliella scabrosa]|nr:hypothetical protein C8Q76DRAFT_355946 [Earliella scabrosa]